MKHSLAVLFFLALGACEWPEPTAPGPKLPMMTAGDSIVIVGRVVSAWQSQPLAGTNIRVLEAKKSVGSDETRHYRLALPPRFRGLSIPVLIRGIGFKPQVVSRIASSNVRIDFVLEVDTTRIACEIVIVR